MPELTLYDLIAHSAPESGGESQSMLQHLNNVADLCSTFAESFEAGPLGEWVGWWHDAGKVHPDVQAYLRGEGPSCDHSSAGMLQAITLPMAAFCVAGHHGGLPNKDALRRRVQRAQQNDRIQDAQKRSETLLREHVSSSPPMTATFSSDAKEKRLEQEMWTRFLHSALVDADYLDTESHFRPTFAAERSVGAEMSTLLQQLVDDQAQFGEPTTKINRIRSQIYEEARRAGKRSQGMYTMPVPTGGGKTRSSMAFALQHATEHDLDRVIVALPYTTIIEQNAQVYRDIFGDRVVLEDHSATGRKRRADRAGSQAERQAIFAAENWDVPIVVTTTVQLLETLFSNQNQRLRKLHNYSNSVIVLDEVQNIPPGLIEPTMWALRELTRRYRSTVLLSTATQPDYSPVGDYDAPSIIDDAEDLYHRMKRVEYTVELDEAWSPLDLAEHIRDVHHAAIICNTTADAARVATACEGEYLSTRLCPAHREAVLYRTFKRMRREEPVTLVSTQMIECGVDISFDQVVRIAGPIDSLIQSAGRCNRNGNDGQGRVTVVDLEDGTCPPPPYRTGRDLAVKMLRQDVDLHDPRVTRRYFESLYRAFPSDQADVQQLRARFQFEDVDAAYQIIPDNTVSVVVDYEDGLRVLARATEAIGNYGYVPVTLRRQLQRYAVNIYETALDKAIESGIIVEVAPELYRSKQYDSRLGLQLP